MDRSNLDLKGLTESSEKVFGQIMNKIRELRRIYKAGVEEAQMSEYEIALRILKRSGWKTNIDTSSKRFCVLETSSDYKEIHLPAHNLVFDKTGRLLKRQFLSSEQIAQRVKEEMVKLVRVEEERRGLDWKLAEKELFREDILKAYFIQVNSDTKRAYILGALDTLARVAEDIYTHGIDEDEVIEKLIQRFRMCGGGVVGTRVSY